MNIYEVIYDLIVDIENVVYVSVARLPKAMRICKRSILFPTVLHSEMTSKRKNHWIILYRAEDKKQVSLENITTTYLCVIESDQGKFVANVSYMNGGGFSFDFYSPHFFQRYSERCKIELRGNDLIKHFFSYNSQITYNYENEFQDGEWVKQHVYGTSEEGVALGERLLVEQDQTTFFKTFISLEMCKRDQLNKFSIDEKFWDELKTKNDSLFE